MTPLYLCSVEENQGIVAQKVAKWDSSNGKKADGGSLDSPGKNPKKGQNAAGEAWASPSYGMGITE